MNVSVIGAGVVTATAVSLDGLTIDDPALTVPDPRMHQRGFVLLPLLDLEPDPTSPDGTRLLDVHRGADAAGPERPRASSLPVPA